MNEDQAYAACMEMRAEWMDLRDAFKALGPVTVSAEAADIIAKVADRMAVKAAQIAGYIIPSCAPQAASTGDAA